MNPDLGEPKMANAGDKNQWLGAGFRRTCGSMPHYQMSWSIRGSTSIKVMPLGRCNSNYVPHQFLLAF